MNTSTLRSGAVLHRPGSAGRQTVSLSINSALRVAKSVAGLAGSFFGQATSPTLRLPSFGMETVMSAKAGAGSALA